MTFEKRPQEFGLKSFSIGIDSVIKNHHLVIGEKFYYLNGPVSTTLPIWGISLTNTDINLFLGKTKDQNQFLPPTFHQNNYTFGFKITKKFIYQAPVEFYFLKKSDAIGLIKNNNTLGVNTSIKIAEKFLLNTQWTASLSNISIGNGVAIGASYVDQKYGTNIFFRKIFKNYVSPSNILTEPGNWFQLNNYIHPIQWLSINQDISYSSLYDVNSGLHLGVNKSPIPEFGYGISFSRKNLIFTQNSHVKFRYKKSSISLDYVWSATGKSTILKITQDIKNFQFWSQFRFKEGNLYQFGGSIPLSLNIKLRSFLNILKHNGFTKTGTGLQFSLKFLKNFFLNSTYEFIKYDRTNEHLISVSLNNNFIFEQTGFGFISGKVFIDVNNNGVYDSEDEVIPDVEIILNGINSVRTDNNGNYKFSFIPKGEHKLDLNLGCIPAEVGAEKRHEIVNTKFLSRQRINFPLGKLGLVEGILYYDDNRNNKFDMNEQGVPNAVIGLNGYLTTTDRNGRFRFANLAAGTYVLEAKVLPPETFLSITDLIYIHIRPGEKFQNFQIGVLRKERPVEKKSFEKPQIIQERKSVIPRSPKISPEEMERLFKKGVDYFIAQKYNEALEIFDRILGQDPEHMKAKDYKKRILARLKILKEK
ncbi:MAG: SdrD B-like domain-containing protein [candidate division WOR-3 bacterium]